MKSFLITMAGIFGFAAIVLYFVSIKDVGGYQVANVQSTVFCAACAVICAVNTVGAIILNFLESGGSVSSSGSSRSGSTGSSAPASNNHAWICSTCGTSNPNSRVQCKSCGSIRP